MQIWRKTCEVQTAEMSYKMNFLLYRQPIPPLQDVRRANPTYMGMTSAAQGKRKFNR